MAAEITKRRKKKRGPVDTGFEIRSEQEDPFEEVGDSLFLTESERDSFMAEAASSQAVGAETSESELQMSRLRTLRSLVGQLQTLPVAERANLAAVLREYLISVRSLGADEGLAEAAVQISLEGEVEQEIADIFSELNSSLTYAPGVDHFSSAVRTSRLSNQTKSVLFGLVKLGEEAARDKVKEKKKKRADLLDLLAAPFLLFKQRSRTKKPVYGDIERFLGLKDAELDDEADFREDFLESRRSVETDEAGESES